MPKSLAMLVLAIVFLAMFVAPGVARDRDHDGLPDRWEKRYRLSTTKKSGGRDPDRDRLSNRREYRLRLNPRRADTDRDGLRDRAEIVRWRTNPRRADTDRDGFKDGVEIRFGTNPRDRSSHPDGTPAAPRPPAGGAPSPGPGTPPGGFPNPSTTGVPAGWTPATTRTTELIVTTPGSVVQDVQFDGADLVVTADNVTVRNVKFRGGGIRNVNGDTCGDNLLVEDTTFEPPPGRTDPVDQLPAIRWGGYTARRVKVWRRGEGLWVSGQPEGCGPVRIENSFVKVVIPPEHCGPGTDDWHTDGVQGWYGPPVIIRNATVDANEAKCGTAPFFYPHGQNNTSADIDRLLVMGGGYSFRLGMPAKVTGLRVVGGSWAYGPIDVKCSVVSPWEARIVRIRADYQVASTVRSQPCNTEDGG